MRSDRGTVPSTGLLVAMAAALLGAALQAEGYRSPELDLHDAGVWVTRASSTLGRVNSQIVQVDLRLEIENASTIDVLQSGETVLVHRRLAEDAPGSLTAVDGRSGTVSEQPIVLPKQAEVSMGGPTAAPPTLAVVDPATGDVWVGPVAGFAGQRLVAAEEDDKPRPPTGKVGGARQVVVGTDGLARVYAPKSGEVHVFDAAGVEVAIETVPEQPDDHDMQVATVGDRFTALDTVARQLLIGGVPEPIDLAKPELGDGQVLQQPSVANDVVLVATDAGLLGVPLGGGEVTQPIADHASGGPARPVYQRGCAWGAWVGTHKSLRLCEGETDHRLGDLPTIKPEDELRFRTNRGKLVVNGLQSGDTYLLGAADPAPVSWAEVDAPGTGPVPPDPPLPGDDSKNEDEPQPPKAVDDTGKAAFATRPGRAVVIDPMRNDEDPNPADVLVIERVELISPAGAPPPQIIDGGLAVQVTPPPGGTETIQLSYTINDGTGRSSEPAEADVEVRAFGTSEPPVCDRTAFGGKAQATRVRAGTSVTHNVLAEARDPDGDTLALVSVGHGADETATANPDGTVVYTPPGTGFAGERLISYVLEDETGRTTTCQLSVTVLGPIGPQALDEPPTARPDHATTEVNREAVLDVLANDSDPDGQQLRVTGVTPAAGAAIDVDSAGRVHVVPTAPGVIYTEYQITDGAHAVPGRIRVDVTAPVGAAPPLAVRDDVVLRVGQAATVDVLANDSDPNGDVLVVATVDVPPDRGLTVEVVEHRFLRITTADGQALPGVVDFGYVVTDGIHRVRGSVVVRPGPPVPDQAPSANPDTFSVRAGTIAALDVLANDSDPEDQRLTVRLPGQHAGEATNLVFAQGDLLRFRAPPQPGSHTFAYEAVDAGGNADAANVLVHVLAADVANNRPRPTDQVARTVAGVQVTVIVPVATMDPDGDPVTLLGVGDSAPAHGSVVEVKGDRLVYLPDRFDLDADGRPDGFFGTDAFTYRVRDALGAESEATIRVGVAAPAARNSPPVAVDDVRVVPAGATVSIDVVRNDSDPDGDPLQIDTEAGVRQPSGRDEASIEDGQVVFDAGGLRDGEHTVSYTVSDGILTDVGFLRVRIGAEGNLPPVAVDDLAAPTAPGAAVTVKVLDNDTDPDGERAALRVASVDPPGAAKVASGGLGVQVAVPADQPPGAVSVVYTVVDANGGEGRAVLRVPVADQIQRRPVAPYLAATTKQGEPVSIDVLDGAVVSPGRVKVLFPTTTGRNGACSASGVAITFTPDPGFVGTAGCTYEIGDGPGDDPLTMRAFGMVGITVERAGNTPPVTIDQPLSVVADAFVERDLTAAVFDPDGDKLSFGGIGGETDHLTARFDGPVLRVSADDATLDGETATITYTVTDGHSDPVPGTVSVTATEFSGALAVAVTDTAETFQGKELRVAVLANDQQGANGGELSLVPGGLSTVQGGTVRIDGDQVVFTPEPAFFGPTSFSYTLADGTDREDRQVQGLVTVNVIGRPDQPPAPAVVRESGAVTLSWGTPAANGAPVQSYWVRATGGAISGPATRPAPSNSFRFDGLTNGQLYRFQIAAVNAATLALFADGVPPDSEFSPPSADIEPNAAPPVPSPPQATYAPTDHAGTTLTVSWRKPEGVGTDPVEYELQVSPPPAGGQPAVFPATGPAMTQKIGGLDNGVAYTFRVKAFNMIQGVRTPSADFSAFSNPETPAAPPGAQPTAPRVRPCTGTDCDRALTVEWGPVLKPQDNGDPVDNYFLRYFTGGTLAGETSGLGVATSHRLSGLANGTDYTFEVRSENKANAGAATPLNVSPRSAPRRPFGVPLGRPVVTAAEGGGDPVIGGDATLSFGPAVDNNGDPARWQYTIKGQNQWSDLPAGNPPPAFLRTGLTNGTTYSFQVRACNGAGCGEVGETPVTVRPFGRPGTPSCCGGGGDGSNTLTWTWTAAAANGHDSLSYRVYVNGAPQSPSGPGLSHTISVPTPGVGQPAQCITVAVQAIGNRVTPTGRTDSPVSNGVPRCGPPGPPPPPPPPPPAASVSQGASAEGKDCGPSGACSASVFHLRLTWSNFSSGTHDYKCYESNGTPFTGFARDGTVSGTGGSTDLACWADASVYGGVYVVVGGLRTPDATW